MNVGWVTADNLINYLNGYRDQTRGHNFAGHLVAITFDTSMNMYCVISNQDNCVVCKRSEVSIVAARDIAIAVIRVAI